MHKKKGNGMRLWRFHTKKYQNILQQTLEKEQLLLKQQNISQMDMTQKQKDYLNSNKAVVSMQQ
jgi:hypothetical protein